MLLSLRKNGLTSLFKEVRVFKGWAKHKWPWTQARKRHININFLVRLRLGRPRVCPWDKPRLSQGQTEVFSLFYTVDAQFFLGTNPVCPWDKPVVNGGRKRLCVKSLCALFAPPWTCPSFYPQRFLDAQVLEGCKGDTHKGEREDFTESAKRVNSRLFSGCFSECFQAVFTVFFPCRFVSYRFLEGGEPPLTLRQEKQYLYFGHLFPCTPGPFSL